MAMNTLSGSGNPNQQAARVLRAQWNRYMQAYTPVENDLIGSLDETNAPRASEMAQEASQRGQEATARIQNRYGLAEIDPELAQRASARDNTLAGTRAFNTTRLAEVDRRDNVRQGLTEVGQSLLNQSTGGLSSAAGMQSQREQANRNARAQASARQDQQQAQLASTAIMAAAMFF